MCIIAYIQRKEMERKCKIEKVEIEKILLPIYGISRKNEKIKNEEISKNIYKTYQKYYTLPKH